MSQFGFRSSPNNQPSNVPQPQLLALRSASSPSPTSGAGPNSGIPGITAIAGTPSTPTSGVSISSVPPPSGSASSPVVGGPGSGGGGAVPTTRCCDTGRPIFTDPLSGQSVCSCQYDLLGYGRLAAAAATAPAGIPALSMYSSPYPDGMAAYFPALGADQAPFYTSPTASLELKENLAAGATWPYPSMYHPYDAAFAGYPFNGYGMDLNGARRKNATRETTSTLKAWLNEHKKNPYPTKGEKIMLAIITKMTLTQVSTWFANARRRLKKENKMTWEPRNRVEDEDNNNEDDDHKSTDGKDILDSKDSGTGSSEDGDRPPRGGSEWSGSRPESPECLYDRAPPPHPAFLPPVSSSSPPRLSAPSTAAVSGTGKPRIWSLADMASKEEASPNPVQTAFYSTATGRLVPRLPPPGLSYAPRPHDLYRSLYGGGSGSGGSTGPPPDVALLESYTRSLTGSGTGVTSITQQHHHHHHQSPAPVPHPFQITLGPGAISPSASSSSDGSPNTENVSLNTTTPGKPMALNKA